MGWDHRPVLSETLIVWARLRRYSEKVFGVPHATKSILELGYVCHAGMIMGIGLRRIGAGRLGAGIWLLSQCSAGFPSF
jgi:hypothetical protein